MVLGSRLCATLPRTLILLALSVASQSAHGAAPDLDTLVVPEPPALVPRKPTEDIRRLLRPEASIIEARNRLDRNIAERRQALADARALEQLLIADLATETASFDARSASLEADRQLVRTRLSQLGRSARSPALVDLLAGTPAATGVATYEARRSARGLLALADRERVRAYAAQVAAWEVAKADLARRTTNLSRTQQTIAGLEQELAWDAEEQAALRAAVVAEPEFYAAYAQEMEKLDELVATKVKELTSSAPQRPRMYMEETRGGLATPIRNTDIVGGFGTRNYKGIRSVWRGTHFYPMRPPPDDGRTEVRAIYWGWVAWTGWLAGLGQVVILDHTMGYTSIYAHLATIDVAVGIKVKTGEILGAMGDTESFFGPRLYMELRKDGVALDPVPWMR